VRLVVSEPPNHFFNKRYRLDLTAASVAYLLEPQWNPMMEEQALCRIHRLGQHKEVKTIRYRMRNSFEEVFSPRRICQTAS
jgi:SNF2 family DNA or RNA helicase